jgi:hypothetical protein
MSDARDVQQVLARLKDAVHSNTEIGYELGFGDPSCSSRFVRPRFGS